MNFWEEEGVCGGWNKWRGPPGAHEVGGAPRGRARPGPSWPGAGSPDVFSVPDILKYSRKIIFNFQGIWRTFIFVVFFIARIIQKTNKKYYFCFI